MTVTKGGSGNGHLAQDGLFVRGGTSSRWSTWLKCLQSLGIAECMRLQNKYSSRNVTSSSPSGAQLNLSTNILGKRPLFPRPTEDRCQGWCRCAVYIHFLLSTFLARWPWQHNNKQCASLDRPL